MQELNLYNILKKYHTVRIGQKAQDWKEAVYLSTLPLIENNLIEPQYYDAIIKSTQENGPYYIIADYLAMPHASSASGIIENSFSLVTLEEPVYFENDDRPVKVLIAFAAKNAEIHTSIALPQIVALFEDPQMVEKIMNAQSVEEIFELIQSVDLNKYIA
ncbi:PTS sugar transporter subunit IIA [Candidatus Mycoplasma pogonae]